MRELIHHPGKNHRDEVEKEHDPYTGVWPLLTAEDRARFNYMPPPYMQQLGADISTLDDETDWGAPDGLPVVPASVDHTLSEVVADPPRWMRLAACVGSDVDMFRQHRQARDLCAACVVKDDCLAYAIEWRITDGIWGGTTAGEREALVERHGFVYVACFGDLIKVGWSRTPDKRVRHVGYVTQRNLLWHETAPGTMRDEKRIHREMAPWLAEGAEWFWGNEAATARALSLIAGLRLEVAS